MSMNGMETVPGPLQRQGGRSLPCFLGGGRFLCITGRVLHPNFGVSLPFPFLQGVDV
jgi:hypothetical protein